MKLKLVLFIVACSIGFSAAYACGYSECGGGEVKCCAEGGATYYAKGMTPVQD